MEICKQQSKIEMRHLPEIPIYGYVGGRQIHALWALKFCSSMEIVGATGLGGLWALEWAWHWINR